MKDKLLIFDLDGVLVNSCDLHYESFNKALNHFYFKSIPYDYHLEHFNGLKTMDKIMKYSNTMSSIPIELYDAIYQKKQDITCELLDMIKQDIELMNTIESLKSENYIACASNCIRSTLDKILTRLGIRHLFDWTISNQDVECPKPNSEIYDKTIAQFNIPKNKIWIFEDSYIGLSAAIKTGVNVVYTTRSTLIQDIDTKPDVLSKIECVIPMAGNGSRFKDNGYILPKPLIDVNGKPMFKVVLDNLNLKCNYTCVVQKEHEQFYIKHKLLEQDLNMNVVELDKVTEGAACTVLLALNYINDLSKPLLIVNSDQYVEFEESCFKFCFEMLYNPIYKDTMGMISTFKVNDGSRKWSYVALDENENVVQVVEKVPISNIGTTGIYLWRHASDYVKYANRMIMNNKRYNNEFYVAPVFNEAILDDKIIKCEDVKAFHSLGTPEDLLNYLKLNLNKNKLYISYHDCCIND